MATRGGFWDGQQVELRAGGPTMCVELAAETPEFEYVACVWFVDGIVHRDTFHKDALNKIETVPRVMA
jgi:uncharacterized protein YodC (DUF2158 family)